VFNHHIISGLYKYNFARGQILNTGCGYFGVGVLAVHDFLYCANV
jgi:hypothetical protein